MARPRRAEPSAVPAGLFAVPWCTPIDVEAERAAYLAARLRAGGRPTSQHAGYRDGWAVSPWAAARHDPDPAVRADALVSAVRHVRDELATALVKARSGWPHGVSVLPRRGPGLCTISGPLRPCRVLLTGERAEDGSVPDAIPVLEHALERLVADARGAGLAVDLEPGGRVEFNNTGAEAPTTRETA